MSITTSSQNFKDGERPSIEAFCNPSFEDSYLPMTSNSEDFLQASAIDLQSAPAGPSRLPYEGTYDTSSHNSHVNSQRNSLSASSSFSHNQATSYPNTFSHDTNQHTNNTLSTSPAGQDFLNSYDYSSEFLTSDFSEHTTPGFEQDFFLSAGFNNLADVGNEEDNRASDPFQGHHQQDSLLNNTNETSLMPAKASKLPAPDQLLSPVLTNTPSPSSEYRNLHIGAVPLGGYQNPSQDNQAADRKTRADFPPRTLQHTPTMTGSSNSSLDPGPMEPSARATSPIVRVSSYSRGDSPARSQGLGRVPGKKGRTSQSSAHLAPSQDEDISEDESELQQPSSRQQIPVPPEMSRASDGSWIPNTASGQAGIDPIARAQMGDVYVPSIKQLEEQRILQEKNEGIEEWIDKSDAGSDIGEDPNAPDPERKSMGVKLRRRARSMGDPVQADNIGLGIYDPMFNDSHIPGPGVLLNEESGDDDDDEESERSEPESLPADIDGRSPEDQLGYFPAMTEDEPLPHQFYRPRVWHDPIAFVEQSTKDTTKMQPATSNAAIMRFRQRAENLETASRSATWGTRRMSETDINKVIGSDGLFKSLSLNRDGREKKTERRPSLFKHAEQAASKLIPKRSNSNTKRKLTEQSLQNSSSDSVEKPKRDSLGSLAPPRRSSSFGKSVKSPSINTGSAVAAMASSMAAVGRAAPLSATTPKSTSAWTQAKGVIRRRSRSELPRSGPSPSPGLAELMTHHGGPPMPTLASPLQDKPVPRSVPQNDMDEEEDEEEDAVDQKGVTMDLKIRTGSIDPTLEGFKKHVQQLNPRLQPFLIDRIGTEQLRRYKKLVEFKVKHVHTISTGNCPSGKHCFAEGGEATMLPPRTSAKDPETTYAGFQVGGIASDDETGAFGDGAVTAAQFPIGVPLPPVKRLPAEFECSLCFKVKKFQKPSDWTKHVHEDVQPFTCTFPNCSEPKSFKRKADWVRHENERHRQLEWWTCNMQDCSHTCFRKDNFVQHLVREHKKPEPKLKATKPARGPTGRSRGGGSKTQAGVIEYWNASIPDAAEDEVQKVWRLVDACHHETKKLPKDEVCKFCGNICNSWKKLTVHLAKHMEQIAMPVLELVKQRDVDPDTIISPVDKLPSSRIISGSPDTPHTRVENSTLSPFSATSSQAHQPQIMDTQMAGYDQTGGYYSTSQAVAGFPATYTPRSGQPTGMGSYGVGIQSGYDVSRYPSYNLSPQQQPGTQLQGNFMAVNMNTNNAPATYPPTFLPSRSSQRVPGLAGQAFMPEQLFPNQAQAGQVYNSPIENMQYVLPTTSIASNMQRTGNDISYTQAGDPQGQYQDPDNGHDSYGYQQ